MSRLRRSILIAGALAVPFAVAAAGRAAVMTTRVSVSSSGAQTTRAGSYGGGISGDGRLVVFTSHAPHLVHGDRAHVDVFVHNRRTGRTTRISLADDGAPPDSGSQEGRISADGRFVVFSSSATNLIPGRADGNGHMNDVFVRDRLRGRTHLVSVNQVGVQGTDFSWPLDISRTGRYILFATDSNNFSPLHGLPGFPSAIYVRDTVRGRTHWIPGSVNTNAVFAGQVSDDGRVVAYSVVSNGTPERTIVVDRRTGHRQKLRCRVISCLVMTVDDLSPGGRFVVVEAHGHILRIDRRTHTQTVVSQDQSGGVEDGTSSDGRVAGGGRFVLFLSSSDDLVPGDTNGEWDVFRRDLRTGTTIRVDLTSAGAQIPAGINPYSSGCMADPDGIPFPLTLGVGFSRDGRIATFATKAPGVVPGDTNGVCDVFVRAPLPG